MAKTILITGASSGIGKTTAKFFHDKGWNVIATMRAPEKEQELNTRDNVIVTKLDVTDEASIHDAVAAGIENFGQIDVLLNNAGYGAYGPLEALPMEKIECQFNTNVIGLLTMTKALYHGTKFAVEGMSESLHYELAPFGVKVKIIQPGMIKTDFGGRSFDFTNDGSLLEYQPTVAALFGAWGGAGENASEPVIVSDVIWQAATDDTDTLRYHAGEDAVALIAKRKIEDDATFIGDMKAQLGM